MSNWLLAICITCTSVHLLRDYVRSRAYKNQNRAKCWNFRIRFFFCFSISINWIHTCVTMFDDDRLRIPSYHSTASPKRRKWGLCKCYLSISEKDTSAKNVDMNSHSTWAFPSLSTTRQQFLSQVSKRRRRAIQRSHRRRRTKSGRDRVSLYKYRVARAHA